MSSFDFCRCEKNWKPSHTYQRDCGGYIVERILDRNHENYCYRGLLSICDMRGDICPPLYLKKIEVLDAEPIAVSCLGQKLKLTLALQGTDSQNRCFQRTSYIELDTTFSGCSSLNRGKVNIRRDIQVGIQSADYCQPCGFQACLSISIESLISRYEIIYSQNECCASKPCLPLYPPAMCSKGERFHSYF